MQNCSFPVVPLRGTADTVMPPPVILCDTAAEEAFSNVVDDGQTQPIEENITAAAQSSLCMSSP